MPSLLPEVARVFMAPARAVAALLLAVCLTVHAQEQRVFSAAPKGGEHRLALVIGNAAYDEVPLVNPLNDARGLAQNLRELGFEVIHRENLTLPQMREALREYSDRLAAGGGTGLFYFAGHGVQLKGRNYLVPVGTSIKREYEVADQSLDVNLVLDAAEDARNRINIVILDACRSNPFGRITRSTASGLSRMDAPSGTLIAFATAPGRVAADGTDGYGLYTKHLIANMRRPGLTLEQVFKRVREAVERDSRGEQSPREESSLKGEDFYFMAETVRPPAGMTSAPGASEAAAYELTFWESIRNSTHADDFRAYLEQYPTGRFATLARNRLTVLAGKPPVAAVVSPMMQTPPSAAPPPTVSPGSAVEAEKSQVALTSPSTQIQSTQSAQPPLVAPAGPPQESGPSAPRYLERYEDYLKLAEAGDAKAQFMVGFMLEHGKGVRRDTAEATRWYRRAAEAGEAGAQTTLGVILGFGHHGVRPDLGEAAKWFRLAAEQGEPTGQANLGVALYRGRGVEPNAREAAVWLRRAADQGEKMAQGMLGDLYREGAGVTKDLSAALKWYRMSADQGWGLAQYALGIVYRDGLGVQQNDRLAAEWIRKSAESGEPRAMQLLVESYQEGKLGLAKDPREAAFWSEKLQATR